MRFATLLTGIACGVQPPPDAAAFNYRLTTEISMPHLEENLRYATTHETRCLTRTELLTAFSALDHPSLRGCSLHPARETEDTIIYDLACHPDHGTTGEAYWQIGTRDLRGTLRVRLGGKNMTFYQRITAVPLAQCRR
jgi:hypothetical protein